MSIASRTMAKKAGKKPVPEGPDRRVTIVGLKGSEAFALWAERLSKKLRMPMAQIVEHALIDYAKSHGFEEEPPER